MEAEARHAKEELEENAVALREIIYIMSSVASSQPVCWIQVALTRVPELQFENAQLRRQVLLCEN